MRRFLIIAFLVFGSFGAALWVGGKPERRYENAACQFQMIYEYQPKQEIGLVTLGGSRLRVSTNARHFNEVLAEMRPNAGLVHNMAHTHFTLEKEYVLLREFLENHSPKAVLVMIEPRNLKYGEAHPDYIEIARLSDIPLTLHTLWPEDRMNAVKATRDILLQHLAFFDYVGKPHRDTTEYDCDQSDFRLNIAALDQAQRKFSVSRHHELAWNFDAPTEEGFKRWMKAYRELAERSGTEVIFLMITGTSEPLPDPGIEIQFEQTFGLPLITMDAELHAALAKGGNRDHNHMNRAGREMFLPWLIERIDEKCQNKEGCF